MTKYYLGSDKSGSGDKECLDEIKATLESSGHTVEYLGINSNLEGSITSKIQSGEIGLFGINGFCIGTVVSTSNDLPEGTNCIFFAMKTHSDYCEEPDYSSKKVDMASDDGFSDSSVRSKYGGNKYTPKQIIDQLSNVSFVPWQGSCSAQAEGIMNGVAGSTSSSSSENTPMSGWDSLCDLMKPLDGLAMMLQRGDTVIVKRIEVPEENMGDASYVTKETTSESETKNEDGTTEYTEAEYTTTKTVSLKTNIDNKTVKDNLKLYAYEGINIVADSVKVTEYSPEIYNTLKIMWGETYENEFILTFNKHKELFGERLKEIYACNKVTIIEESEEDKDN